MDGIFSRTELLLGNEAMDKLKRAKVIIFGAGGVGGYVVEALCRSGVGSITVVDGDSVAPSNINRQIIALHSTIGKNKAEAYAERMRDINPEVDAIALPLYFNEGTKGNFDFKKYDYVIDAIDSATDKLLIAEICHNLALPLISCMGAGNKLEANFVVTDIYSTEVCPLARVMRRELKKRGIDRLKVVYSKELPKKFERENGQKTVASIAFIPSVAGLVCAGEVIKDLIK